MHTLFLLLKKKSIKKSILLIIWSETVGSSDHSILCGRWQLGGHSWGSWSATAVKTADWPWPQRAGPAPWRNLLLTAVCVGMRRCEAGSRFFAGFVGDQQAGRIRDSVFTWRLKYFNSFFLLSNVKSV